MAKAKATVHGAISLVNAIATKKGATLGIELKVDAIIETTPGKGISIISENKSLSSRLINKTTGYGLKSSSAISSAVALACSKIFKPKLTDKQILLAGVEASIESKVSITGAYDDACSCYYGGFNVTDNFKRNLINSEKAPANLIAVIFIPKNRKRGNLKNLKILSAVFENAWELAKKADYWNAMNINGLATAATLNSDPKIIINLLEKGAYGASVSGNGPAIAAITKKENESNIKKVFSTLEGNVIVSKVNNKKAEVYEL
jgi:shikimate kinase